MKCRVIVTTMNSPDYLRRCLNSIAKETTIEYELTVVVDAANKETLDVLDDLGVDRIVNTSQIGWTKAVNQGIKHEVADIYAVISDDTIVTTGWLGKLANALRDPLGSIAPITNKGGQGLQDMIHCETDNYDEIQKVGRWVTRCHSPIIFDCTATFGFCFAIPQYAIERVGYFDEKMFFAHSDIDYCYRLHQAGLKVGVCIDVYVHHFGAVTVSKDKRYKNYWNADTRYFNKKWGTNLALK